MLLALQFFWLFGALLTNVFGKPNVLSDHATIRERDEVQELVTWDSSSIFVRGERIMFFSGEFHPFRLPSPGLWLDVFQKVKALGYSGVSFYVMWALLEGEPGQVRTEGVFALESFFNAAKEAGIYLLARPGPYINAEVSGGGFPGWLQRIKGRLRSSDPEYLDAVTPYISQIGRIISAAQITQGGPIILVQPENEYALCDGATDTETISACLDKNYMAWLEERLHEAGITVPLISNDAFPLSNFLPGSGTGEVDIYGYDYYPFGWGAPLCANPSNWTRGNTPPAQIQALVQAIPLPTSPRSITEFQGGSSDPWGGVGSSLCASLTNQEFERVFYKMNYGLHATVMNIYMTYGGTNWGNLGHPLGYTSYDVGAAIKEDRQITREKYAEMKLQANFHRASPAFLTASPQGSSNGIYTNSTQLTSTVLFGLSTKFYIIRHSDYTSLDSTSYVWRALTSLGNITIPQLGSALTLHGRDSKIHVVDFDIGGINLIYSSAEILTWNMVGSKRTLLLYGGLGEVHEFAVSSSFGPVKIDCRSEIIHHQTPQSQIFQWIVKQERTVISFGDELDVYLLWRNDAYNYWIMDLPAPEDIGMFPSTSRLVSANGTLSSVIINGGHLLRNASVEGAALHLVGDVNVTTRIEIISAPQNCCSSLSFNGRRLNTEIVDGRITAVIPYQKPKISIPDLKTLEWLYIDSLPEIKVDYDDRLWTICNLTTSNNPREITTPFSLYADDYGYHCGSLIYRGHFLANGNDTTMFLQMQGGNAFGYSAWLNSTFLGSWFGDPSMAAHNQMFSVPKQLISGTSYTFTILIDHMGLDEDFYVNDDAMKAPRGILDFSLSGHPNGSDLEWRLTGNIGGEHYYDHSRGPLNEGAMFAERQGYHLPGAPVQGWIKQSPFDGIQEAGVGFFMTNFKLNIPAGYDIPLSVVFNDNVVSNTTGHFRVQIYVNGWQFGEYVNNLGPQKAFPVPEGIIDHNGENILALTLWSLDKGGTKLTDLSLKYDAVIQSGYSKPQLVNATRYALRNDGY